MVIEFCEKYFSLVHIYFELAILPNLNVTFMFVKNGLMKYNK